MSSSKLHLPISGINSVKNDPYMKDMIVFNPTDDDALFDQKSKMWRI